MIELFTSAELLIPGFISATSFVTCSARAEDGGRDGQAHGAALTYARLSRSPSEE